MIKTLLGKNNYLFLTNDSSKELEVHCNNLCNCNITEIYNKYKFPNYYLTVYPDKSIYYKNYLPDSYEIKYRPALDLYKRVLNDKILDTYEFLKLEEDCYYKTDTHINLKGNYFVYCKSIEEINKKYNLNIKIKNIKLEKKENVILKDLGLGIGDLTWDSNTNGLIIPEIFDNYYYTNDIDIFYLKYSIDSKDNYIFYDYNLKEVTKNLENQTAGWHIISDHIIYNKSNDNLNQPVFLIFYDSFLLHSIQLFFYSFKNAYFIKNIYDKKFIDLIKPDYVFEFRVERFLF